MKSLIRFITIGLYALVAAVLFGGVGLVCGNIVADIVYPHPNVHILQGLDIVVGGALIGALIGVAIVIVIAVRSPRNAAPKSEELSE